MATREGQLLKSVTQIQWFIVHSVFSKYPAQILWNERTVDLSFCQCKQPWSRVKCCAQSNFNFYPYECSFLIITERGELVSDLAPKMAKPPRWHVIKSENKYKMITQLHWHVFASVLFFLTAQGSVLTNHEPEKNIVFVMFDNVLPQLPSALYLDSTEVARKSRYIIFIQFVEQSAESFFSL